ncbi:MAG TPA: MFS transporter [Streptosporangiaceae bacterium]|nr:MFS transporter [Streptosporangiaceae bacterium]
MNVKNTPEGTIRGALRYPAFRALLAGLAVSQAGDWLYNIALVTLVYQRTGSAMWAGVTTAARIVPMVVLGPFGGIVADRFDQRRVMVACDLVRLALMLALALVAAANLPAVLAPVIAALATAAATPYLPSVAATTPRLVAGADLPGANAARAAVTGAGIIAGPALGGVLLLLGQPALAFVVNAATFGASAVCVLAIRAGGAFRGERAAPEQRERAGLLRQVADGAAALRAHPAAVRLVGADIVCSLVYGMQTVLFIFVARSSGLGLQGYGYLFAALGAGGLAGTALASRAARMPGRAVLVATLAAVGLPVLLLAVVHWGPAVIVLAGTTGTGAILVQIMTETGLQRTLPDDVFGRAYGLAIPVSIGGIGAGSLIASALASTVGLTGGLLVCGSIAVAYGAVLLRGTDRRTPAAVPASVSRDGESILVA